MTEPRVAEAGVELLADAHGLPTVLIRAADGARALAYLHGGHVTSWTPAASGGGGGERLFLSAAAEFRAGAAIRGGVPVIFPQFAGMGPLPKHGFARTTEWTLDAGELAGDGGAAATLLLNDSAGTRAIWPHAFALELTVAVGGPRLALRLDVVNPGDETIAFTAALHTYLRVGHVSRTAVRGLEGARYRDSAAGNVERVQEDAELLVAGEIDRIYLGAPRRIEVAEPGRGTVVESDGFPDAVVWNPGPVRGALLADLEPGGASHMLCVEAAAVGAPVRLAPGERWSGTQTLTAVAT